MDHPVISPKKLIEVALPLDAINAASAVEKQPFTRRHPRSIHIWWARRPSAAARAVNFSQLVHDPEDLWRCQNPGIEPNRQVNGSTQSPQWALLAGFRVNAKADSPTPINFGAADSFKPHSYDARFFGNSSAQIPPELLWMYKK